VREQRVLLGLVEPVDLVDEQDRPRAVEGEPLLGRGDRGPDLGHAGHDCREAVELGADLGRQKAGQAGLARARRTPQEQRREVAARHAPAQRAALTHEVLLPDELLERAWAHAGRQRLPLGGRLEEGLGPRTLEPAGGWHDLPRA
jgi:hypothetical protein